MTNEIKQDEQSFEIRIDKDGVWFYNGAEMFRKDIVQLFYEHLVREESGRYAIVMPKDHCYIVVEDVPFIVQSLSLIESPEKPEGTFQIHLNNDKIEALDLQSLWIGTNNAFYCTCHGGRFEARFCRAAYYQLANFIECDEDTGSFYIVSGGGKFYLPVQSD
jgi:uncharacterized protein